MRLTWHNILECWIPITLDLHEKFGIDTDSGILHQRTWFWLRDRILDLIDHPSRLRDALQVPATYTTA